MQALAAANAWQVCPLLVVRRAALATGAAALDAWRLQREESKLGSRFAGGGGGGGGALATLTDVAGRGRRGGGPQGDASGMGVGMALGDRQMGPLLAALVDTALKTLPKEPDDLSRALRADIGRAALALDQGAEDVDPEADADGYFGN